MVYMFGSLSFQEIIVVFANFIKLLEKKIISLEKFVTEHATNEDNKFFSCVFQIHLTYILK